MKGLTVECVGREGFGDLEPSWPALLARTGHEAPFYRHEFLRVWMDSFAPRLPVRVVLVSDKAGPRAALCLVLRRGFLRGLPVTVLSGAANLYSERFDLLAAPDDDDAIDAVWRHVRDTLAWQVLELPEVPPREGCEGAAHALLARAAREVPTGKWESKRSRFVASASEPARVIGERTAKFQQNLRRRERRLAERGPLHLERITGGLDLEARLEEGFLLEASGWKGRAGTAIAMNPALRAFYAELAREAAAAGYLSLHFLFCGDTAVAFQYALSMGGRTYLPKVGIDEAWRAYAPGHLLVVAVLRDGAERGITELDFLGPDMQWKQDWTASERPHHWCYAFRDTRLGHALHAAKFRLGPWLKEKLPWSV